MSIKLGMITSSPSDISTNYDPINIIVDEDYNAISSTNLYGKNVTGLKDAQASITLEFDAITSTTLANLRDLLSDRTIETKVFVNEPSTYQVYDASSLSSSGWYQGNGSIDLYSYTLFSGAEITSLTTIDTNAYSLVNTTTKYSYLYFRFDISSFISAYGASAIDRLTLFLHNPWCSRYDGQDTFCEGYRILVKNGVSWYEIGQQSYAIADSDLRASSKINQQFFSLRKVAEFTNIVEDIVSTNYIQFLMVNKDARSGSDEVTLGLNCVGLFINGYGVRQTNVDNFTYRDPYTDSGYTGTIVLTEV